MSKDQTSVWCLLTYVSEPALGFRSSFFGAFALRKYDERVAVADVIDGFIDAMSAESRMCWEATRGPCNWPQPEGPHEPVGCHKRKRCQPEKITHTEARNYRKWIEARAVIGSYDMAAASKSNSWRGGVAAQHNNFCHNKDYKLHGNSSIVGDESHGE